MTLQRILNIFETFLSKIFLSAILLPSVFFPFAIRLLFHPSAIIKLSVLRHVLARLKSTKPIFCPLDILRKSAGWYPAGGIWVLPLECKLISSRLNYSHVPSMGSDDPSPPPRCQSSEKFRKNQGTPTTPFRALEGLRRAPWKINNIDKFA